MDSWIGRLGVCFLQMLTSSAPPLCPILLVVCIHEQNTSSFLIQVRGITIVLLNIFLHREKRAEHLIRILFYCLWIPMRCRWTSTWRCSVLWILLVLRSFFDKNSWTLLQGCNVVNPGKIFHSNSIGSPSIVSKALYSGELLNHVNLSSDTAFDCGFSLRWSFQGITQNLKIRRPLCARDWWLLHHWPKINVSMKSFQRKLYLFHRSRLIVRLSIFQICRTSVSLWDLLYFWWNVNCLSNSSPWIQMHAKKEDINILHITECLSLSFVASFEDWFCLFRTWSFTLCKNDLDCNDISDSAQV